MALLMDRPNGDGWAHLVSDLPGTPGSRELRSFGESVSILRRVHREKSYAEHYDIRGDEITRAARAGAKTISRRELGKILREKKKAVPSKNQVNSVNTP